MNRQTKQLLALAGVLAVGLGAYAALRGLLAREGFTDEFLALFEGGDPA